MKTTKAHITKRPESCSESSTDFNRVHCEGCCFWTFPFCHAEMNFDLQCVNAVQAARCKLSRKVKLCFDVSEEEEGKLF